MFQISIIQFSIFKPLIFYYLILFANSLSDKLSKSTVEDQDLRHVHNSLHQYYDRLELMLIYSFLGYILKLLNSYTGKNEKTKIIVKLTKSGSGAGAAMI